MSCQGDNLRFCTAVWTHTDLEKLPLSYRDHHVSSESQDRPHCLCSSNCYRSCSCVSFKRSFWMHAEAISHSRMCSLCQQDSLFTLHRGRKGKIGSVFPATNESGRECGDKFNGNFHLLMMLCLHRYWYMFMLRVQHSKIKAVILYHFNPV